MATYWHDRPLSGGSFDTYRCFVASLAENYNEYVGPDRWDAMARSPSPRLGFEVAEGTPQPVFPVSSRLLNGDWLVGLSETPSLLACEYTAAAVRPSFNPITRVGVF